MNDTPIFDIYDEDATTDLSAKTSVLVDRRRLLTWLGAAGTGTVVFHKALATQVEVAGKVTVEMVAQAEWIAGIELSGGDGSLGAHCCAVARKYGLLTRSIGDTVVFLPPLVITRKQIDEALAAIGLGITETLG